MSPRQKRPTQKDVNDAFVRGFACAAAIATRWGTTGADLLNEGGFTLENCIAAGVEDYDIKQIRFGAHGGKEREQEPDDDIVD